MPPPMTAWSAPGAGERASCCVGALPPSAMVEVMLSVFVTAEVESACRCCCCCLLLRPSSVSLCRPRKQSDVCVSDTDVRDQVHKGDQTWDGAVRCRCTTSTSSVETETCKPYCPKPLASHRRRWKAVRRRVTTQQRAARRIEQDQASRTTVMTPCSRCAHTFTKKTFCPQAPNHHRNNHGVAIHLPPSLVMC